MSLKLELLTSQEAEKLPKPNYMELFTDVYDDLPPILQEQAQSLVDHLKHYKDNYPVNNYKAD